MQKLKILYVLLICYSICLLYLINPESSCFFPKCPFKLITDYNCPGCGIQRAIYWSLHGDFKKAIQYNYFLIIAIPYALGLLICSFMPDTSAQRNLCTFLTNRYVVYVFLTLCLMWFILRNFLNL